MLSQCTWHKRHILEPLLPGSWSLCPQFLPLPPFLGLQQLPLCSALSSPGFLAPRLSRESISHSALQRLAKCFLLGRVALNNSGRINNFLVYSHTVVYICRLICDIIYLVVKVFPSQGQRLGGLIVLVPSNPSLSMVTGHHGCSEKSESVSACPNLAHATGSLYVDVWGFANSGNEVCHPNAE